MTVKRAALTGALPSPHLTPALGQWGVVFRKMAPEIAPIVKDAENVYDMLSSAIHDEVPGVANPVQSRTRTIKAEAQMIGADSWLQAAPVL